VPSLALQGLGLQPVSRSASATSLDLAAVPAPGPTAGARPTSARVKPPVQLLLEAVRSRDEANVRATLAYLLEPNGSVYALNERHHFTGRAVLHDAVMDGQEGIVAVLLAAGADPNVGPRTTGPPIMHAAGFGMLGVLALLLRHGADVDAANLSGGPAAAAAAAAAPPAARCRRRCRLKRPAWPQAR
jgi:hypothetical protein